MTTLSIYIFLERKEAIEAKQWNSAPQGDADAQYNLGVMYANGEGVTQDYKEAVSAVHIMAFRRASSKRYFLNKAH